MLAFVNVLSLSQELTEVFCVDIRLEGPKYCFKLRIILLNAVILFNSHVLLHAFVVVGHELEHLLLDVVFLLFLRVCRLLVLFEFFEEHVLLSCLLRCKSLLLRRIIIFETQLVFSHWSFLELDVFGKRKPNALVVVHQKFGAHSQNLNVTHFLDVVRDFEALNVGKKLVITSFQHS